MANWDLFRELDNMRREIDETFRNYGLGRSMAAGFLSPARNRFPLMNVREDSSNIYVDALVPGVDPNGIDVSVLRNAVTISGERKSPLDEKGQVVHRSELGFGKFSRTIELPGEIDTEKITAQSINGLLRVTLAKAEHAKPKKIEVKLS
ncbi:Hsp20/alpha crystallin family protein [Geotalea sp. SG265]|uniref:Hsp20/alpha crystallin family protein n=1 Tax=Geotalea sp. SG265 TaxID=2922867 RepID=UPI001FAE7833|nr:Hsp20/alpha crystallin family protein [Geotalea sp. SG265]